MLSSSHLESLNEVTLSSGTNFGMGLMLCKQIIEKYGGKFDFNSEYNKGSTFVFSFGVEIVNVIQG